MWWLCEDIQGLNLGTPSSVRPGFNCMMVRARFLFCLFCCGISSSSFPIDGGSILIFFAYLKTSWFLTSNYMLPCKPNLFLWILGVSCLCWPSLFHFCVFFVYDRFFWELIKIALLLVFWNFMCLVDLFLGPGWTVGLFSRDAVLWSGPFTGEILPFYLTPIHP